jgi:hypothetical protein
VGALLHPLLALWTLYFLLARASRKRYYDLVPLKFNFDTIKGSSRSIIIGSITTQRIREKAQNVSNFKIYGVLA